MLGFRKPTPDELKHKAYLINSEWGPAGRIPREQRLADKFHKVLPATRAQWLDDFKAVDKSVEGFVLKGGRKTYSKESYAKAILEMHPWLNRRAIERTWFLTCYFAWHEGLDK
jgi:hypothetical protein